MKNVTQGGKAYLKVGTGKLYGKHFMPLYIKPFGERRPDIDIEFIEDRSVILESMLLNGILDIGIIPAPIESNILISRPLFYEELFLALPRDHKMNLPYYNYTVAGTFPEIDLHLLSGEIFIISKTGYKLHDLFTNMCKMMGFKPRSTLEIESVDTIISFVRNNKGIGFVPDSFARREMWAESVNYYRIKNANCKRAFMIVHADETKLSLTAAEFVSVLFEIQEKIGYK
ncbi:MAG: LysR family transcriptional regulator substrate-binding protein [Synergistaceae bacterium]|nr:LysR family transcriptional regulator substrate-binding protein [Synergistaceae bacterium]